MSRNLRKNLAVSLALTGILAFIRLAGAQDFGTEAVNNGLGGTLTAADPRELAGRIINILLGLLGVIAVGLISYAGFLWMSAGGEEEKIETAKKLLKNGLIGLAIILSSWAIATFIITRLAGGGEGGGNYGCTPGSSLSCGCYNSGLMVCDGNGNWGACVGQNCNNGGGGDPTSCDGNDAEPGCQAAAQICSPDDYCDSSSCNCLPRGGQGDSCDTDPSTPTCEADNGRCGEYLTCNPLKGCTCDGPPVITSVSPSGGFCEEDHDRACTADSDCLTACNTGTPSGAANNLITIFGQNFGQYEEGASSVLFEGGSRLGIQPSELNEACVDTWRDDQIVIAVPAGVSPGAIKVTNKDDLSDSTGDGYGPAIPDFLPSGLGRPGLCYLDPNRGILSSEVGYQGVNLLSSQAYFGNYQNNIRALDSEFTQPAGLSGKALTPNINSGESGSFVQKPAAGASVRSNFLRFTKESEEGEGPFISSFYPTGGPSGQYVTLRGRGFGGARGTSRVYFGDTEAAYDFPDVCLNSVWRYSQIIVKVPVGLADGYHTIRVSIGTTTIDTTRLNPNGFASDQSQPLKTSLCKIEPDRGPASTPVSLWGEYFGPVNGSGLVKFNYDKTATGTIRKDGRADKIDTTVPAGAISGPVRVINNSNWGNELNFSIGECTADSDCGTQICCPAGTYKAGRCSQTLDQCFIEIPSSVFEWRFSTGFATSSTGTPPCVGPHCFPNDPCQQLSGFEACQAAATCCFDGKTDSCRSGEQISGGADLGYCAYYDCDSGGEINGGGSCASDTPLRNGTYSDISSCEYYCANPPSGPGLSCAGYATSTCVSNVCNFPGFSCLLDSGDPGLTPPACGTCCCQPGTVSPLNPDLDCIADQGACTGAGRGLYCGCTRDEECGAKETVGCGSGACCESRPEVVGSLPAHLDEQVCRNAVIRVDFNLPMDAATFSNNVLLLEERDYGNGVCPTGTFVVEGQTVEEIFAKSEGSRLFAWFREMGRKINIAWRGLSSGLDADTAQAVLPDPNKLYCAVPGTVSGENNGEQGSLFFAPQKVLAPSANYYFLIKGDEELDSQTGILSVSQIGMNGRGYYNLAGGGYSTSGYVEGASITFNGRSYKNSHIIKFSTLSAQGPMAGICAIDRVGVTPSSYLFKTSDNGLDENDTNFNNPSFDTAADRDKLVTAQAYSENGQVIQPVTGYFWDWQFSLSNADAATLAVGSAIQNLPANRALISAKTGITDAETKVEARIIMDRFSSPLCTAGSCACAGSSCTNNCCNAYLGGDDFNRNADFYVFICNNPWPPVAANGTWSPWLDNCQGSIGGGCAFYNYKFYYCRDAGAAGTLDDLPAIINQAVIRGASSNLICSSDRNPCPSGSVSNTTRCGQDQNGDGAADGLCIWDVLKESYFFRSNIPSGGELLSATDLTTGGSVRVDWRSDAQIQNGVSQIYSYKIYYLAGGRGGMLSKEVKPGDMIGGQRACTLSGTTYNCSAAINGLSNNIPYVFKISVVSVGRAESQLSSEKRATPTDKTPPAVPTGLSAAVVASSSLRFSWTANTDDAVKYRLYRGIKPGQYGEWFDSQREATSLSLPLDRIAGSSNYFTLSALDGAGNESVKQAELPCSGSGAAMVCGAGSLGGGINNNIRTNLDQ